MPKLTQSFVKSLAPAAGGDQLFYMDDELTGFGLRVSMTRKVFYLQMRVGGRVLKRKIESPRFLRRLFGLSQPTTSVP